MSMTVQVDPLAAVTYFVERLGCTAFPVWGSRDGQCSCGDPHDGVHGKAYEAANVGKHPATAHGFKDATADLGRIRTFLANPGTPNYGLIPPEGVLVIDVDGPGLERWEQLQHEHGPLPITFTTTTANGRHYWFRWPEDAGPMPRGQLFGFVVRHHGDGYVIGPGSVHPTGTVYDTLRQPGGMPYDIAELPASWIRAITGPALTVVGGRPSAETVEVGGRHDWLRDTARYYAGVIRDRAALKAAIMVENAKLAEPKSEAAVERAIDRVLEKFPADPVFEDEETGELRRDGSASDELDLLDAPAFGQFPEPPDEIAFAGLVGECIADLEPGTDASRVGLLGAFLAFAGALIPGHAYFHRTQTSSPFVALVGESAIGRKGTAMIRVLDAFGQALEVVTVNRVVLDGLNSGEGLVSELDYKRSHFAQEPTVGLVFEEEYATLLAARGRDGSTLDPKMRQAFDGGPLSNRKSAERKVVTPPYWLPALIGITPVELRARLEPGALQSGSANRWLYLPVVQRDVVPGNTPPIFEDEHRQAIVDAHRAAVRRPLELVVDPRVTGTLDEYADFLPTVAYGLALDLTRRLSIIAFRIALVHALVEREARVRPDHLDRALALTEYARRGLGWVFGDTFGNRDADLLFRHLVSAGRLTRRVITQHIVRDPIRRQAAIDELLRLGRARVVHVQTAGRPRSELVPTSSGGAFVHYVQGFAVSAEQTPETVHGMHESAPNDARKVHESRTEGAQKVSEVASWASPCYFYSEHQSAHRQTPAGFICTICSPTRGAA